MIKLSIIVPCYNIEKYIRRCIESILPQLSADTELIVINDGSTDNSLAILNTIAYGEKNIIIQSFPNGGLATARNRGIDIAKGKYYWFVDGDDYIQPEAIRILLNRINKNEADIIAFNHAINTHKGIDYVIVYTERKCDVVEYMSVNSRYFAWNKIYSSKLFKKFRFQDGLRNIEDYVFNLSVSIDVSNVSIIPDVLYVYEQTNLSSISKNRSPRHMFQLASETYKAHEILMRQYPTIKDEKLKQLWAKSLNTSFAGMIFSLFRFYNCRNVKRGIDFYRTLGVYPFKYTGNYKEKALVAIANNKPLWPLAHIIKNFIH